MSDKPSPQHLSVVSSFTAADYPYFFTDKLISPGDHIESLKSLAEMRNAAHIARIADYKLFERHDGNTIHFRTAQDLAKFKVATEPGDKVKEWFFSTELNYDVRKLKRIRSELQDMTDKVGFGDTLRFKLDRKTRTIYYEASSKNIYFAFADFAEANHAILQPFLSLQRKEPEFDIPFPSEEEAVQAKISYDDDDEADIYAETEPSPQSMGITLGGKTEGAEKSKDRSHLSLVKDFEPRQNGYIYKLTPKVVFDPERSQADFMYRENTDYPSFKIRTKTEWVLTQIRHAMEHTGVPDYHLSAGPDGIQAWFKTLQDRVAACISLAPDMAYRVDFLQCDSSTSPMKISKKVKKLQEIFSQTGENVNFKFIADKERHVIQVATQSGNDYIRLQAISRRLEKTNGKFQKLIGLDKPPAVSHKL
ncbi:MAG TPA: hypothetical protein VFS88_02605 [Micavibrio sp.]|nr:hypothetical protein [Micavibrio sp.]